MTPDTIERLDRKFAEAPILCAVEAPSTDEVDSASQEIGIPFSADYREFILRYGGAIVGSYPIFGLRGCHVMGDDRFSVIEVTNEYREDYGKVGIDCVSDWVVFSEDHAGNPIGMDATGKIWTYDHDFGGLTELASNFEEYLRKQILEIKMSE